MLSCARILGHCALFLLVATILTGCSDPYAGRKDISGTVILAGQPLKAGSITFVPLEKQGTRSGAEIEDGKYQIPYKHGLKPGKYQVQITSGDGKNPADEEAANPGGSTNIVSFDLIPEDWNVNSKQQIEVKKDGDNKFDFDIPKVNVPKPKKGKKK